MGHSGLLEYQRGVLLSLKARQEAQDSSVRPGGNDPRRIALTVRGGATHVKRNLDGLWGKLTDVQRLRLKTLFEEAAAETN
jgi:hypothetical protein